MNTKSVEFGILVKGADREFFTLLRDSDWGHKIPNRVTRALSGHGLPLTVETKPFDPDFVFISFGDLGEQMPSKPKNYEAICEWLKCKKPTVKPRWGVIHTER